MTGTAPTHPLKRSPHKLKLGVFGLNVSSGCSMTERTDTLKVEWDESVKIAQLSEQAKNRYDAVAGLHALGSIGTGTEVAEGVEYLICAEWVTGVALEVDGGIGLGASHF